MAAVESARATTFAWSGDLEPTVRTAPGPRTASAWSATNVSGGQTVTNWVDNVIPTAGSDTQLVFATAAAAQDASHVVNDSPYNDLATTSPFELDRITFNGDSYMLGGGPLEFTNSSTGTGASILQYNSSAQMINEAIILANTLTLGGGGTGTVTIAGNIAPATGASSAGLTLQSTGTFVLSGSNTYTGTTNLSSGTLSLESPNAVGSTGAILFNGGTLQFSAANTTDYSAQFAVAGNNAYLLDTNGQNVTLATRLSGSAGLRKSGAGQLILAANDAFGPGCSVSAGTLSVPAGDGIASPLANITVDGPAAAVATMNVSGTVTASQLAVGLTQAGTYSQLAGSTTAGTAYVGFYRGNQGPSILAVYGGTFTAGTLYASYFGSGAVYQSGGTVAATVLYFGNSLAGYTTASYNLAGGTLSVGQINVSIGASSPPWLHFDGGTLQASADITVPLSSAPFPIFIDVGPGGASFNTAGHSFTLNTALLTGIRTATGGGLTKLGAGTLTLAENDTYTGSTVVTGGDLRATNTTGSATGTGTVTVQAGGTLGGTGTVGNASTGSLTVAAGGTITAGASNASTGTLTTGPQVWNASGGLLAKVSADGSTHDQLVMSSLSVNASAADRFTVTVTSAGTPAYGGTPLVLAYDQDASVATNPFASQDVLASLALATSGIQAPASGPLVLDVQPDVSGVGYDLVLTATPEPTSLALVAAAAPLVLGRHRRRA